jgi:hypothetical protein
MKPKEKAIELVNKFLLYSDDGDLKNKYWKIRNAKQCALIAIDEMLDFRNSLYINEGSLAHQYLVEIKKEIIKI